MKQLLLSISLFVVLITNATTYYISPSGNDNTGNGTIGNPWKTLYKATSTVSGMGDIIHVNAGTYTETQKAIVALGVSIEGDGPTLSIIKSTLTADWTEMIQLYSSAEGTMGNQHISDVKLDGQMSTFWAIQIVGRSNVSVYNCLIVDFKEAGVFFNGRTDNVEGSPTIFSSGNSFHDNTILNCAAYNTNWGTYGRGALNIGGQIGMLVYNNTMVQNQRPDGYNGWLIKYGLGGYNKGLKIYNNTITKIPYTGNYGGENGWDFCLELWHSLGGLEIYNNTCQGAFDLVHTYKHGYSFGSWVHHNTISQPILNSHNETGILYEKGVESALVENNIVDKCSSGLEVFCEYFGAGDTVYNPVIDLTVRNNQFTNIGKAIGNGNNGYAIQIVGGYGIDGVTPVTVEIHNVNIYNNTMTAAPGNAPWFGIGLSQNNSNGSISNVNIVNNIIQGFYGSWLIEGHSTLPFDSLSIKNNLIDQNGNSNGIYSPFTPPTHYVNSGNILATNSLFVSATDFHLQGTSPAIDAGINVGISFTGSAPDMGCYEYGAIATSVYILEQNTVLLYPNPTTDVVTLNLGNVSATSIEFADILGKTIMTKKTNDQAISLSLVDLAKGIYTVKINTENSTITKKIIKE